MSQDLQGFDLLETQDKPWCRSSLQVGKDDVLAGRQAGGRSSPAIERRLVFLSHQAFSGLRASTTSWEGHSASLGLSIQMLPSSKYPHRQTHNYI